MMDYLAGFYIIVGFVIIFYKSSFLKNYIYEPLNGGRRNLKKALKDMQGNSYPEVGNMTLQKIPVRSHYNY
jgi:hypothetical protein